MIGYATDGCCHSFLLFYCLNAMTIFFIKLCISSFLLLEENKDLFEAKEKNMLIKLKNRNKTNILALVVNLGILDLKLCVVVPETVTFFLKIRFYVENFKIVFSFKLNKNKYDNIHK